MRLALILVGAALVSGAIGYLANQLGRYIGRRKLTMFKLRPRHTSILITVLTGVLISQLAIVGAYLASGSFQKFVNEMDRLLKEREELTTEVASLKKEAEVYRGERLIYRAQDTIIQGVVPGQLDEKEVDRFLERMLYLANQAAVEKNDYYSALTSRPPLLSGAQLIDYQESDYQKLAGDLAGKTSPHVVMVIAKENSIFQEKVSVMFATAPNRVLYRKGELILGAPIDGRQDEKQISSDLYALLQILREKLRNEGVLPDPATGKIFDVPITDLIPVINAIRRSRAQVQVRAIAEANIDCLPPVRFSLKVSGH